MLSVFPSLLNYGLVAPLLIRVVLGITIAWIGYAKICTHKETEFRALGVVEIIMGILLVVGYITQLMAFLVGVILVVKLSKKVKDRAFLTDGVNYYIILLVLAVSLLFSGPGFLAFDLPL